MTKTKEDRLAVRRAWYQRNKEREHERQKDDYKAHHQERRLQQAEYFEENKENIIKNQEAYREKNREWINEKKRKRWAEIKDKENTKRREARKNAS